ncbi:MAG: CoA transferase, partial [Planctomycetota bacterium]
LFLTNADRTINHRKLHEDIEAATRTMTTKECLATLAAAGVPSGPINSIARTLAHPQIVARQMIAETEHPSYGKVRHQGPAVKFTNSPSALPRPAPLLGEHNSTVPADWGI